MVYTFLSVCLSVLLLFHEPGFQVFQLRTFPEKDFGYTVVFPDTLFLGIVFLQLLIIMSPSINPHMFVSTVLSLPFFPFIFFRH